MKGQKWILNQQFSGNPTLDKLSLVEFDLPETLEENEVLLQAVYWTVDPYMRLFPPANESTMIGEQLSEVIKTRNGKYPLGTLVLSRAGWTSHYVSKGEDLNPIRFDIGSTPLSYTLGALGMPGATAWLSFNAVEPKPNETILISGAAGAVGHIVGQLAKLKGLTVIGLVGSEDKKNWLLNDLKFDHVINYKTSNWSEEVSRLAPDGVNIYYDNVGGEYYHTVIDKHIKMRGRILCCGSIQTYNDSEPRLFKQTNVDILVKELTVKGFIIFQHDDEMPQAFSELKKLIDDGKLIVKETTYVGIENMFEAFSGLFKGDNTGKAVVRAVNQSTNYPHK